MLEEIKKNPVVKNKQVTKQGAGKRKIGPKENTKTKREDTKNRSSGNKGRIPQTQKLARYK